MKKKGTRKIRKNKRTTQRRKNRSYKRMRGGVKHNEHKKIVKLLKNLIINNTEPEYRSELCRKQQTPIKPAATDQQPLVLQSVLLEHTKEVDETIGDLYKRIIQPNKEGKYQFTLYPAPGSNEDSILNLLKDQGINYFDDIVGRTFDILSPDEFIKSLSQLSLLGLRSIFSRFKVDYDKLVISMFALSVVLLSFVNIASQRPKDFSLDPFICEQTANV